MHCARPVQTSRPGHGPRVKEITTTFVAAVLELALVAIVDLTGHGWWHTVEGRSQWRRPGAHGNATKEILEMGEVKN